MFLDPTNEQLKFCDGKYDFLQTSQYCKTDVFLKVTTKTL